MGQAKQRGSYEQRREEGVAKANEREAQRLKLIAEREAAMTPEARAKVHEFRNLLGVVMNGPFGPPVPGYPEKSLKSDKGRKNGSCNRRACQKSGAVWFNKSTRAYYCGDCAHQINHYAARVGDPKLCEVEP